MRSSIARDPVDFVWIALSAVTAVSWALGAATDGSHLVTSVPTTLGVLAIALLKARGIIRYFMEVQTAPTWLRRFTDLWMVALWGSILTLYLA